MGLFDPRIFDTRIFDVGRPGLGWPPAIHILGRFRLRSTTAMFRIDQIIGRWRAAS